MRQIYVSDVMTRDPITIKPDTNLLECAKKMVRKNVGSLVLVEGKKLIGFISQRDILWALVKKSDLSKVRAKDISPRKIATIKPTLTINDAIKKMKKLKFERLPVIHEKELVGMITAKDIFNFTPELYPELTEFRKIREEANKLKTINRPSDDNGGDFEGICEECGGQDILYRFNGMLICESCRNST